VNKYLVTVWHLAIRTSPEQHWMGGLVGWGPYYVESEAIEAKLDAAERWNAARISPYTEERWLTSEEAHQLMVLGAKVARI